MAFLKVNLTLLFNLSLALTYLRFTKLTQGYIMVIYHYMSKISHTEIVVFLRKTHVYTGFYRKLSLTSLNITGVSVTRCLKGSTHSKAL